MQYAREPIGLQRNVDLSVSRRGSRAGRQADETVGRATADEPGMDWHDADPTDPIPAHLREAYRNCK